MALRRGAARWLGIALLATLALRASRSIAQEGPGPKEIADADAQQALGAPAALPGWRA